MGVVADIDAATVKVSVYEFACTIYKVQTLADGGYRVTLDVPSEHSEAMGELMKVANAPAYYKAAIVSVPKETKHESETKTYT